MNKNQTSLAIIASVLIAGGLGFWGGDIYSQHIAVQSRAARAAAFVSGGGFGGGLNGRGGAGGAGAVRGDVISVNGSSMTVKLPNGSTRLVILTGSTSISKGQAATTSDIQPGNSVAVFGAQNSDQSLTATSVQLNPPAVPGRGGNQTSSQ